MSDRPRPPGEPSPRVAPRQKVFLPAEMTGAEGASRIHLLNLSPTGALVHGEAAPKAGAIVQLSCAGTRWSARVVWVDDKRFGVVHAAPMAPAVMDRLVAGGAG